MPMKSDTLRALPAILIAALSGAASAAGFQLWEQNASGIGTSYAGSAAIADNASTIYFNPAGMTQSPGIQLSAGMTGVAPRFEFNDAASYGTGAAAGLSGGNGGNAGGWAAVPNGYVAVQVAPDWFVGLGVSSPFGLRTEYEDANWIGRYQALKSEVRTLNINPSLAWRVSDKVSLGLGLNYQKLDAELTSAGSRLTGDDTAWGWNAGALFTLSPAMRVGVSYRSALSYTLEGDASTAAGSTPVRANLRLPDTFILSVWQQVSDRWEAMGDLSYTNWSTLKSLDVVSRSSGAALGGETFNYDDSWRIAWGAAYKATDALKLKFGIAYDHTPTSDGYRSARLPDNDRLWLSLGAQWNAGAWGRLDVGYAYLYLRDPNINQTTTLRAPAGGVAGTSTLLGRYDDSAHVVGAQYSVGF